MKIAIALFVAGVLIGMKWKFKVAWPVFAAVLFLTLVVRHSEAWLPLVVSVFIGQVCIQSGFFTGICLGALLRYAIGVAKRAREDTSE